MSLLLTLLDGPSLGPMLAIGFLFVVVPIAALLLLIWLFKKGENGKMSNGKLDIFFSHLTHRTSACVYFL